MLIPINHSGEWTWGTLMKRTRLLLINMLEGYLKDLVFRNWIRRIINYNFWNNNLKFYIKEMFLQKILILLSKHLLLKLIPRWNQAITPLLKRDLCLKEALSLNLTPDNKESMILSRNIIISIWVKSKVNYQLNFTNLRNWSIRIGSI